MKKYPGVHSVDWLLRNANENQAGIKNGSIMEWVPARPLGYPSFVSRFKTAWRVFKGELDGLKWPGNQ